MARLPTLKSLPLMGTAREPPPSDEVSRGEGGQLCRLCGKAKQERVQSDSRKDRSSSGSAARGWVPDQERHHSWRSFWGARGRRGGKAAGQSGLGAESWDGHVWGPQAPSGRLKPRLDLRGSLSGNIAPCTWSAGRGGNGVEACPSL